MVSLAFLVDKALEIGNDRNRLTANVSGLAPASIIPTQIESVCLSNPDHQYTSRLTFLGERDVPVCKSCDKSCNAISVSVLDHGQEIKKSYNLLFLLHSEV